jgi:hypothetical protein
MTRRKRRSLVRGNKIFLDGAPRRWQPVVDRSIPVDPVREQRASEDDWLPDEDYEGDQLSDEGAAVAFLDEVLGDVLVLGDHDVEHAVGDNKDATECAVDGEPQP